MSSEDIDPLAQAVYETVHGFKHISSGKKGAPALSKVTGIKATTLQNKADRTNDNAILNLHEARTIMVATQDFEILRVLARELDYGVVPLPDISHLTSDMNLLEAHTEWVADFGETANEFKCALDDGKITKDEIDKIRKEMIDDFEKGMALLDVMAGKCYPEKVMSLAGSHYHRREVIVWGFKRTKRAVLSLRRALKKANRHSRKFAREFSRMRFEP